MLMTKSIMLFSFGLVFGSFFNVLIWRIPRKTSIISPGSHCPQCNHQLSWFELIPIFSFMLQKGRCRSCQAKISWEYPLVELITAIGFVIFGLTAQSWQQLIAILVFFSSLLVASVIDLHHKILPNIITLPSIGVALIFSVFGVTIPIFQSLLGILIGGGVLLILALIYPAGMGMGDVKFLALIGSFVGPFGVLLSLFIGSTIGTIAGLIYIYLTKQGRNTQIPFGPCLALGAYGAFIYLYL